MTRDTAARRARVPFEGGQGWNPRDVEENRLYEQLAPEDKLRFITENRRGIELGLDEEEAFWRAWRIVAEGKER